MDEADFVIIGGGTAGCVLANRLSADGQHSVCMIEAGGEGRSPWIHIPLGYGKLAGNPSYSAQLSTAPEPELNNRRIGIPRGRVLGGCSSTNGLLYVRGQAADYDGWAQAGNLGWSYADVLPYFRRAEHHQPGENDWHGIGGPIGVSGPAAPHELAEAFITAAAQEGIARNDDFNGPVQEGAGYYAMTARNFLRSSTATAYLRPARRRPNLHVVTGGHCTRIGIEGGRAGSVDYLHHGRSARIVARREVILAGGAVASPQLLLLSGLGPAEALRDLGIAVVADMPGVGRNLSDHANIRLNYRAAKAVTMNDRLRTPLGRLGAGLEYVLRRTGPLTVSAGFGATFFRTDAALEQPDFQGYLLLFRTNAAGTGLEPFSGFMTSGYQLRPESRGHIALASPDPLAIPVIQPRYLSTETDRRVTLAGIKQMRAILRTPPIAEYVAESEIPDDAEDEALMAYIREKAGTGHHLAGSCRMGTGTSDVVDPRLRVHGIGGLRVIDASIMPAMVSGNTCAPVVMIAEKGADMILEDVKHG